MKNFVIFSFLLLLSIKGMAQHQNIPAALEHLVAPLQKSDIPSGFLWDKGTNGLAEPAVFDGHLYDSAFLPIFTNSRFEALRSNIRWGCVKSQFLYHFR